jgi:hypothetical protein
LNTEKNGSLNLFQAAILHDRVDFENELRLGQVLFGIRQANVFEHIPAPGLVSRLPHGFLSFAICSASREASRLDPKKITGLRDGSVIVAPNQYRDFTGPDSHLGRRRDSPALRRHEYPTGFEKIKLARELPDIRLSRTLRTVEVHFTPEQEAQLAYIATKAGTDLERLVKDTVLRLLQPGAGDRAVTSGSVVAEMRALRARVKPDPEGWSTRDYVLYGRR